MARGAFKFRNMALAVGEKKTFENILPGARLTVNPGAGATVTVQYLTTPTGVPYAWTPGPVAAQTSAFIDGPLSKVIISTAAGAASTAELTEVEL